MTLYDRLKSIKLISTYGNFSILFLIICLLVIVPFFPITVHKMFYNILLTLLFMVAIFALNKYQKEIFSFSILVILTEWASYVFDFELLYSISTLLNIIFFIIVVSFLIAQLAGAKKVSTLVILEAINGYLLLGIAYSMIIALVANFEPGAFSFHDHLLKGASYTSDYFYYGFVTYSTLGYGDISPLLPFSKGISILITVSGQLYLAIIIALLVGKYLSQPKES